MGPVHLLLLEHFALNSIQHSFIGVTADIVNISCFVRDRDAAISAYFSSRTRRKLHRVIRIASQHPVAALRDAVARPRSRPTRHRIRAAAAPALQFRQRLSTSVKPAPGSTEPGAQRLIDPWSTSAVVKPIDMNSSGQTHTTMGWSAAQLDRGVRRMQGPHPDRGHG